ncbi:MAG: endonuclease domain-containing protein [Candidatus Binatia bacterium]
MARSKEGMARRAANSRRWAQMNPEKRRAIERRAKGRPEPTRARPATCECCGGVPDADKVLALDHCHETGVFRGWLCGRCNRGIGLLGDSVGGLERAIRYLRRIHVKK